MKRIRADDSRSASPTRPETVTMKTNCELTREAVIEYRRHPGNASPLDLALGGAIEVEAGVLESPSAEAAAGHIAGCNDCKAWLDTLLSLEQRAAQLAWQARLARYCCLRMLHAVNPDIAVRQTGHAAGVRFSFERFRGEDACWCINDTYVFARYCPWCGKELPNEHFEVLTSHCESA